MLKYEVKDLDATPMQKAISHEAKLYGALSDSQDSLVRGGDRTTQDSSANRNESSNGEQHGLDICDADICIPAPMPISIPATNPLQIPPLHPRKGCSKTMYFQEIREKSMRLAKIFNGLVKSDKSFSICKGIFSIRFNC